MNATAETIRAPRLTDKLLSEDLPHLVTCADDQIEYLNSRLADTGVGQLHERLAQDFRRKRDSLQRSREWLARKIAAETNHRSED